MEKLGYIAGFLTVAAYAPQTIKTIRTRKTRDLSLLTYIVITTAAAAWTIYGIGKHSLSIAITNGIVGLLTFAVLIVKIKNGRGDRT